MVDKPHRSSSEDIPSPPDSEKYAGEAQPVDILGISDPDEHLSEAERQAVVRQPDIFAIAAVI